MATVTLSVTAVFIVLAAGLGLLAGGLALLLPTPGQTRWSRSTLLWTGFIAGPFALALIGVLAMLVPMPFSPCHCAEHGSHHPHLCLVHPALASVLLEPAGLLVAMCLLIQAPALARLGLDAFRAKRWVVALRKAPSISVDGTSVRLLSCGAPTAFTVGAIWPVIVLDSALWQALSPTERSVVVHHERGHALRGDGFTLLALRLCLALQPWLPRKLLDRWRLASELACDEHAAQGLGDRLAVAEALVQVERLRGGAALTPPGGELALGLGAEANLERRVKAILEGGEGTESSGNDILKLLLVTLGAAALAIVWPGDSLHHGVETLIGLISH